MFFDAMNRQRIQCFALVGVGISGLLFALADGFWMLMLVRFLAGLLGGPVVVLGQALLADAIPPDRRGRAMAVVLGANALAAVVGVPLGLLLADGVGWQAAFCLVAVLSFFSALANWRAWRIWRLRCVPAEVELAESSHDTLGVRRHTMLWSLIALGLVVFATFLLVPNLSAFAQHNLSVSRAALPSLYALGGALGVLALLVTGRAVDRFGVHLMSLVTMVLFGVLVALFILPAQPWLPGTVGLVLLLMVIPSRNVALKTMSTMVPPPNLRGRYLAVQGAIQQGGALGGAVVSALLLSTHADGRLVGMAAVGWLAVGASVMVLLVLPLIHLPSDRANAE